MQADDTPRASQTSVDRTPDDSRSLAAVDPEASPLFACRRCGHCCHGDGGIVLGPRDLARLCAHLGMDEADFLTRHTEQRGGKSMLRAGPDGYCEFFRKNQGCSIHPARPDVCRAWPYFRGNLVDEISFGMARQDCPGIADDADHASFAREGYAYLKRNGLIARDPDREGRALVVAESDLPHAGPRIRNDGTPGGNAGRGA